MALGFDAISDAAISGETVTAGPASPVAITAFVSNANAPPLDARLTAGFAVLFAVGSLASSNTAQAAEYQFGTHAAAIYESQFKGAIWGPAQSSAVAPKPLGAFVQGAPQADPGQPRALIFTPAPAAVVNPVPIRAIGAAPQAVDPSIQGWIETPQALPQGRTPSFTVGSPQSDPTQTPAQVFPSARTPPIAPNPIAGFVTTLPQFEERVTQVVLPSVRAGATVRVPPLLIGAPQFVDLSPQGWIEAPQPASQGRVPPIAIGQGQADPTQIAPRIFPSVRTPAIVPNPIAGFVATAPQFEERVTAVVYPSLRSGQTPPRIGTIVGSPQSDPGQIAALLIAPARALAAAPGVAPKFSITLPQFEDRPTSVIWSAVRAGQRPPRITSLWAAPQNVDLTLKAAIFAPSASAAIAPLNFVTPAREMTARETGRLIVSVNGTRIEVATMTVRNIVSVSETRLSIPRSIRRLLS